MDSAILDCFYLVAQYMKATASIVADIGDRSGPINEDLDEIVNQEMYNSMCEWRDQTSRILDSLEKLKAVLAKRKKSNHEGFLKYLGSIMDTLSDRQSLVLQAKIMDLAFEMITSSPDTISTDDGN
ncbi:uncharacterized protein LOC142237480 [Haematobia irritans]|uniref:uncharacterized protein LOC142237480 n=1 Tax=Haematobia irritans TaxID=7368 RepID=UPI003F4F9EEA